MDKRQDFAFETTLSGKTYLKLIDRLQNDGWRIELVYLTLPSMEMSKLRGAERVAHGGHNIPVKDISRRFPRSLKNLLMHFSHHVDRTRCFMNSSEIPELIFEQQNDKRTIAHQDLYPLLLQESER
ncbi:zeta toxin family protein [Methylomarinum sp. Ch1-1]|uniref:Zeta toxin family protein n=1 Tax=Methylomarinum roseum TaxID=3067653 RepID=A0AAU7P040_9GAMM